EHLRVAARRRVNTLQVNHIRSGCPGEGADGGERGRQRNYIRCSDRVRRKDHVARGHETIERRNRANRTHVITANRKLIAQEVTFVNRHAVNKRERVRVLHLVSGRATSYRAGDNAETENLRILTPLVADREELRVFERRLISAHVATQAGEANG